MLNKKLELASLMCLSLLVCLFVHSFNESTRFAVYGGEPPSSTAEEYECNVIDPVTNPEQHCRYCEQNVITIGSIVYNYYCGDKAATGACDPNTDLTCKSWDTSEDDYICTDCFKCLWYMTVEGGLDKCTGCSSYVPDEQLERTIDSPCVNIESTAPGYNPGS